MYLKTCFLKICLKNKQTKKKKWELCSLNLCNINNYSIRLYNHPSEGSTKNSEIMKKNLGFKKMNKTPLL